MEDNQLIALMCDKIEAALASFSLPYAIAQKDQPTQEGTNSAPTVLVQKLFDHHYGQQGSTFRKVDAPLKFTATEDQVVITTIQISALVTQNPEDLSIPTASDLLNKIKIYLQHRITIAEFKALGAALIGVKEIRNPPFDNDKSRFEYHPSFDVELQHKRTVERDVSVFTSAVGKPSPIPGGDQEGTFPVG